MVVDHLKESEKWQVAISIKKILIVVAENITSSKFLKKLNE